MTKDEIFRAHNENAQRAYQVVFGAPAGRQVLGDLIAFCFGRKTEFDPDARLHAFNSGKRAVLLRIAEFMNLTLEEIYALRGFGRPAVSQEDNE